MADNGNPVSEPLKKTANAAMAAQRAAQAAIKLAKSIAKLAKTIASTAKGAAVGNIYGAIAAFVWENKGLILKITFVVSLIILIPSLIICMLPSVIFNGLNEPYSVDNGNALILNDSTVITNNIDRISDSIGKTMAKAKEDVLSDIERDFQRTNADKIQIIDPYESKLSYSVASFVSQYSASKSDSYQTVSISELESIMENNRHKLFSYTKQIEERTATVYDEALGKETEIKEKWAVYSVVYNGEEYFADNVFYLTDKQKALAADYRENLKQFLGEDSLWEKIK